MSDGELERRQQVSFLQAEGLEPLPSLQVGTKITPGFRAFAFTALIRVLGYTNAVGGAVPSDNSVQIWVSYFKRYEDDLPHFADEFRKFIKVYIEKDEQLYDLLQYCVRARLLDTRQYRAVSEAMREELLGYRFVGRYTETPTLFPVDDTEEADANQSDYSELGAFPAAASHFRQSIENIKQGHFRGSVTESISGVESVVKSLSQDKSATLGSGLKLLSKKADLHPALRAGLEKIYGWTNSPNGMRHSLSDDSVEVSEAEARYMLSACLAFAAWLKRSQM